MALLSTQKQSQPDAAIKKPSQAPIASHIQSVHAQVAAAAAHVSCAAAAVPQRVAERAWKRALGIDTHHSLRKRCSKRARSAAIIPGSSTAELVLTNGLDNTINLFNIVLIGRLLLTWFPNPPPALVQPLSTLADPYLNLFRGLIPFNPGGLDFSPILAFLVLNAAQSTAAALPRELGRPDSEQANKHLHANQVRMHRLRSLFHARQQASSPNASSE